MILLLGLLGIYSSETSYSGEIKYIDSLDNYPTLNTVKAYEIVDGKEVLLSWLNIFSPSAGGIHRTNSSLIFEPFKGVGFRTEIEINEDTFTTQIREIGSCIQSNNYLRIIDQYLLIQKGSIDNNKLIGYYYCKSEYKRRAFEPKRYIIFKGEFIEEIIH